MVSSRCVAGIVHRQTARLGQGDDEERGEGQQVTRAERRRRDAPTWR